MNEFLISTWIQSENEKFIPITATMIQMKSYFRLVRQWPHPICLTFAAQPTRDDLCKCLNAMII